MNSLVQYTGEKMDPEAMVALLNYREDGVTRQCLVSLSFRLLTLPTSLPHLLEARYQANQVLNICIVVLCFRLSIII